VRGALPVCLREFRVRHALSGAGSVTRADGCDGSSRFATARREAGATRQDGVGAREGCCDASRSAGFVTL
jgi:hypothetical protein